MFSTAFKAVGVSLLLLFALPLSEARASRAAARNGVQRRATGWAYVGCYADSVGARTLTTNPGTTGGEAALTIELCTSTCQSLGFVFAGAEYSGECYCGNSFSNGGGPASDGSVGCNMACNGNATEICGGPNRLSVYDYNNAITAVSSTVVSTSTTTSSSATATATATTGWLPLGCYTDSVGARTLATQLFSIPGASMTVEACTAACLAGGYSHAGVEYADECYCANAITNGAPASDGSVGCNMLCTGNTAEECGGSNRINIYNYVVGWSSLGCYTDSVGARTLATQLYSIPGASMTVEACEAACLAGGFSLAGVEYADECHCASTLSNGGGPAPDGSVGCNMPCTGDTAEECGGSNRLNLYSYGGSIGSTSTTAKPTSTTAPTSSTSTVIGATGIPTGWTYKGCWVDQAFGRILSANVPDNAAETVESCIASCVALGYSVAGMEYFTQCYCGNAMINQASLATSESDCNTACGGNSAEICGGGNRMSIYSNQTTLVITPVPKTQTTGLPGSWKYSGCITDNAEARSLAYQLEFLNNNTATNCLSQCELFGYGAGGMEYGEQCFCGDAQNLIDSGTTVAADTDCNMVCSGNDSYICGGSDRISYYTWTGTPLNSWTFQTGVDAGEYQFLIGAPIIPLIAQPGINGKITFLEKFGTEPANNSTGAYELDMSLLSNFTAAWRPMHVKTDVFCSAGLTLPDKAGRLINIGGWANDATYGVRLYSPDGVPGTWGVNDWHENVLEVSLVRGRWYPTAMMMANGSILVMGGEQGSNTAPIPSLEILPLPPGSSDLYCDYLFRTDPYNLYPYLAVLPSGGVFVAYYNEARILDEVSLQTKTVLPNIPGAVNDFLGGRTYPFEGTAMLLPQHAPYTDPLTVIICGGSIPGPEYALDNCASITPEVAGANWTIERMPSRRVMSCMAALPDGTYLIMNGAQQGRAGFGLATSPNLNALLYDPSKPVNQRMSVMANTTIARLYHSEASLLDDGRVLVTGSDPEDLRFPQEYRVEIFVPPYLLKGNTPPTFTISKTDLAYGEAFTVNVKLFQGTTSTMQISLMASVSSTHGNSMGQRTIFPAFTCAGTVCTVIAPPNANVSPPAWSQLFVLDNGTPSTAVWVRIGGDPAGLGNWPNFPDFEPLPGV